MPLIHWAMPSRYHSIHKNDLARAMVAQSEQAFLALAQSKGTAAPVVKVRTTPAIAAIARYIKLRNAPAVNTSSSETA